MGNEIIMELSLLREIPQSSPRVWACLPYEGRQEICWKSEAAQFIQLVRKTHHSSTPKKNAGLCCRKTLWERQVFTLAIV